MFGMRRRRELFTLLGGCATSMTAAKLRNLAARPAKPSLNPRPIPQ
jgi:hypothetical protein